MFFSVLRHGDILPAVALRNQVHIVGFVGRPHQYNQRALPWRSALWFSVVCFDNRSAPYEAGRETVVCPVKGQEIQFRSILQNLNGAAITLLGDIVFETNGNVTGLFCQADQQALFDCGGGKEQIE